MPARSVSFSNYIVASAEKWLACDLHSIEPVPLSHDLLDSRKLQVLIHIQPLDDGLEQLPSLVKRNCGGSVGRGGITTRSHSLDLSVWARERTVNWDGKRDSRTKCIRLEGQQEARKITGKIRPTRL